MSGSVASNFDLSSEQLGSLSTFKHVRDDEASINSQRGEADRVTRQIELYKKKLAAERKRLESLNESILAAETKALEQKRRSGGESLTSMQESKMETEKEMLVGRLNKQLVTLNTKIAQNKKLRQKIDELRNERCRYDEIYTKLELDTQKQSERMAVVLEQGKTAIKKRDKAIAELEALTKQLEEGRASLKLEQEELRTLEETVQKDEQVDVERTIIRPIGAAAALQKLATEKYACGDEEFGDEEETLDEALVKVFELTGINDVDLLIERLVQTEELQFSLFSRINELEAEVAANEVKISDKREELKRAQRCGVNSETQKQKELATMEEKRRQLQAKVEGVDTKYESQMAVWRDIQDRILSVHSELGLELPADLVKDSSVSESNVFQYLAAIESKASEILASICGDHEDEDVPLSPVANIGPLVKTKTLDLPSATANEGDDDGERPLSLHELQESLRASA